MTRKFSWGGVSSQDIQHHVDKSIRFAKEQFELAKEKLIDAHDELHRLYATHLKQKVDGFFSHVRDSDAFIAMNK